MFKCNCCTDGSCACACHTVQSIAYSLFRFVFGGLFLFHGLMKFGVGSNMSFSQLPFMFQAAGIIEIVVGVLIALGLISRVAAIIGAGEMAVAFFTQHVPNGGIWPLANGGEAAVLFCFAFLAIASMGAGKYSIDEAACGDMKPMSSKPALASKPAAKSAKKRR